ncbi:hypothetical protein CENSYa_0308 [Cenarchaeum symbiosum A]|uniref:Uncharacterized protein n=1 Tax=Cenarchaeum symbiosum (strain A) TaxID=414004 RepID=A0RUC8_CENSY|nr:hypothetical protein CENSYa_0308 [Cenarchaeum symbiosum A]
MSSSGVSPWELEVAYGYFVAMFAVRQEELEPDPDFISVLKIEIPVQFSQEFFDWFGFRRWDKIKSLFKEMKRRRGSRKAIKLQLIFAGSPSVTFVADAMDKGLYDNSIEKIDFVLELLPYHLGPGRLPANTTDVSYRYDGDARRWRFGSATADGAEYEFKGEGWKKVS